MPGARDLRELRIEKQLGSAVGMLLRAAEEAESMKVQDLADELHEHYYALNQIYGRCLRSGARRAHRLTSVRN